MALDERAGGPHRHAAGPRTDLLVPALRAVSLLSQLSMEQLGELAAVGRVIALEAGQDVFREGDEGDSLYVVLSGSVRIYTCDGEGYEVEVDRKQAGESFGEIALLDGGRRSASVGTSEPCVFFTLDRADFATFLTRHPALLTTLLTHVTTMVRRNVERVLQDEMAERLVRVEAELARHRAIGQLVAGVAHEINTPLGTIVTAASILKRAVGSELIPHLTGDAETRGLLEDAMEAVTLIERNAQRAHQLIQSFKKISVSQITDTKERLNLPAALEEIVGLYRINARRAGLLVTVHPELPAGSGDWEGYLGFLTQIILNLLTNVERYAYPAGAGGRVDITLTDAPGGREPSYRIRVRDYGAGIPAAHLERAFEPFFTTGRSSGGTGLGLAIVHNLVTAGLKGTITLQSTPGEGTEAIITVPHTVPD
jgi:signal transduction histidine kinase